MSRSPGVACAAPRRVRTTRPSRSTCRRILHAHQVPDHIRRHSARVARVARQIAEGLLAHGGAAVDVALVEAAALLHDIAKAPCLESRLDHAAEGGRMLRAIGLDAAAVIVERHVHLGPFDPDGPVTEAEIVNYADKRVRYEEVVSLEERFLDLIVRYGEGRAEFEERIRGNWRLLAGVEAKIFARLPFGPEAVARPRRRP
jgi:putative nucleotidyltransferase with HDIG domain